MASRIANLGTSASAAGRAGMDARWGGRGKSKFVRVDPDVAELVKRLPERVRRSRVSAAIRKDVAAYLSSCATDD